MKRRAEQTVIRQHSGWLIPLGFAAALLALSALFLAWYLRPGPGAGAPIGDAGLVQFSIRGQELAVPANYLAAPATRGGGEQASLTLIALLPDMRGYSKPDAALFAGNAPDSRAIRLILRGDPNSLGSDERLARIYRPALADPEGAAGPFGLTQYGFKQDSTYSGRDLFAGDPGTGMVLYLCERGVPDLPSPNCLAIAPPPEKNLGLSYRFKRAYLSDWRQIAAGVNGLMARIEKNPPTR